MLFWQDFFTCVEPHFLCLYSSERITVFVTSFNIFSTLITIVSQTSKHKSCVSTLFSLLLHFQAEKCLNSCQKMWFSVLTQTIKRLMEVCSYHFFYKIRILNVAKLQKSFHFFSTFASFRKTSFNTKRFLNWLLCLSMKKDQFFV